MLGVSWDNVVPAHVSATTLNWESFGNVFLVYLYFIGVCLPFHENHQHVQVCNPATTTSLNNFLNHVIIIIIIMSS